VRDSGVLDERDPLNDADHLCWVYEDPASFVDAAQCYMACARTLTDRGVQLRIQAPPRAVVRIWRVLGMDVPAPVTFAGAPR
jgi:hypothetical protein